MSYSDRDAYDAIVSALASSRAFRAVRLDDAPRGAAGVGPSPMAVVSPGGWEDSPTDDPDTTLRRVSYRVTISVRGDDARSRFREADRLAGLAMDLLDGADLGGGCVPSLSKVEKGECRPSVADGEATCELRGTFSYLSPSSLGFVADRPPGLRPEDLALVGETNRFTEPQVMLASLQVGIDSDPAAGQLHVSSADPARPALVVDGAAGQTAGVLLVRAGDGSVRLTVSPAGELGIGTAPSSPLHVAANAHGLALDIAQANADPAMVSRIAGRFVTSGPGGAGVFNYATFHVASGAKNNRCIFAQATSGAGSPDVNIGLYALADGGSVQNSAVFAQGGTDAVDFAILAINRTALRSQNAGIPALEVRGVSGMTAPLVAIQDPAGATIAGILGDGGLRPASLPDASASNHSIYFSSTLGKLAYKDAAGTVHPLY
ncbi:hypothetical protein [Tautonia sociabilis]|uniref:Uncharacterized protein n=1 Tax=Tautonia sociabilis TaxID=2080755 RepID=A0A432MQ87_9BACT|nr:hypothetical protein [Tautonia sociabilis]RUL89602.1 hypothetical protein TsocGM_00055 [Tautonia sociabilis]